MSLPEILPALPEPQAVIEVGVDEPARHPVLAYVARLNMPVSRESTLRRLNIVARMLSDDTSEAMHFHWERITHVVLSAVRAKLMQTSAPATCNVTLAAIKGVLKECWRLGYLSAEEMQRACDVSPVRGERVPTGRALKPQELRQLLSSCQHDRRTALGARDAAVIGLTYGLGLRTSEAISLDLGDYDPKAGTVTVIGKGNKQRALPVPAPVAAVLGRWLGIRGLWAGPLLSGLWGPRLRKKRMDRRSINCVLKKRRQVAGVAHFRPHDLRRSFISNLLDAGVDLSTAQKLAGHSDPKITSSYDRRGMRAKQQAMGRLPFPGGSP